MENRSFNAIDTTLGKTEVNLGMPLYKYIKQRILQKIAAGEWHIEAPLPNEKTLSQTFEVSIGTLRKAVEELVSSGILVRQQGRGTFVAKHCENRYLFNFFHIIEHNKGKEHPMLQLLEMKTIKPTERIASDLQISLTSSVIYLKNLLFLQKQPVILDTIYLPSSLFPNLLEESVLTRKGTLYQLYQEHCNVSIIRTDEYLRTASANSEQAKLLNIKEGSPLLHITRVASSLEQRIVELRYSLVNSNNHDYYVRHFG